MSDQQKVEDAQRGWVRDAMSSDLGLWWLAADTRELRPGAPEDEVRLETLRALRPLLASGALRAVHLLPGEPLHPGREQRRSNSRELMRSGQHSGPPDLGDVVWFIGAR